METSTINQMQSSTSVSCSLCVVCFSYYEENPAKSKIPYPFDRTLKVFCKYFGLSPETTQEHWKSVCPTAESFPFCYKCSEVVVKLLELHDQLAAIHRQIAFLVSTTTSQIDSVEQSIISQSGVGPNIHSEINNLRKIIYQSYKQRLEPSSIFDSDIEDEHSSYDNVGSFVETNLFDAEELDLVKGEPLESDSVSKLNNQDDTNVPLAQLYGNDGGLTTETEPQIISPATSGQHNISDSRVKQPVSSSSLSQIRAKPVKSDGRTEKSSVSKLKSVDIGNGSFTYGEFRFEKYRKEEPGGEIRDGFKCALCDRFTEFKPNMLVHIRGYHMNVKGFDCSLCDKTYSSLPQLIKHYSDSHPTADLRNKLVSCGPGKFLYDLEHIFKEILSGFRCLSCSFRHEKREEMITHVQTHKKCTVTCPVCGKELKNMGSMRGHMLHHKQDAGQIKLNRRRLNLKGKTRKTRSKEIKPGHYLLRDKYPYHKVPNGFQCGECQTECKTKSKIALHIRQNHMDRFECEMCGKQTITKSIMDRHKCKGPPNGGSYGTRTILRAHEQPDGTFTLDKYRFEPCKEKGGFTCCTCGAYRNSRSGMTEHVKQVHVDNCKFVCDQCGKRFSTARILREHQRIHSDICLFQCDRCPESFKTKIHLYMHNQRKHETWQCGICSKFLSTKRSLNLHLKTHSKGQGQADIEFFGEGSDAATTTTIVINTGTSGTLLHADEEVSENDDDEEEESGDESSDN